MFLLHTAASALFFYMFNRADVQKPDILLYAVATRSSRFITISFACILAYFDIYMAMLFAAAFYIAGNDLKHV